MSVRLANDEKTVVRIDFTALVAGHHPRRDAGGTHQHHEGGGVVFAKATAGNEEEFINAVATQQGRLQGVVEGLGTEIGQRGGDDLFRRARISPRLRQGHGAWIEAGRQS